VKYLPCEFCHKFLSKHNLWRHLKTCKERQNSQQAVNPNDHAVQSTARSYAVCSRRWVLNSAVFKASEECLIDLMNRMRDDGLKEIIMNDPLIRKYAVLRMQLLGDKKFQKHNDVHRVSQSTRLLARIVVEARKQNASITLDGLMCPSNFDLVAEVARQMSIGKDQPALNVGRTIGLLVNHVALVKHGTALRCGDKKKSKDAQDFRKLHKSEWNSRINSPAVKCINAVKRTKTSPSHSLKICSS
jgi:hypothetical protein